MNGIAQIRDALGWSQQELADAAGTTQSTIFKLESGEMRMSTKWADKISAGLIERGIDISPATVMFGTSTPQDAEEATVLSAYREIQSDEIRDEIRQLLNIAGKRKAHKGPKLIAVPHEAQLITLFRRLKPDMQDKIIGIIQAMI